MPSKPSPPISETEHPPVIELDRVSVAPVAKAGFHEYFLRGLVVVVGVVLGAILALVTRWIPFSEC